MGYKVSLAGENTPRKQSHNVKLSKMAKVEIDFILILQNEINLTKQHFEQHARSTENETLAIKYSLLSRQKGI